MIESDFMQLISCADNTSLESAYKHCLDETLSCTPTIVTGPSGVGKSLLLSKVSTYFSERYQNKVCFMRANEVAKLFVDGVRNNSLNDVKKRIQRLKVLILENLEDFYGKDTMLKTLLDATKSVKIYGSLYDGNNRNSRYFKRYFKNAQFISLPAPSSQEKEAFINRLSLKYQLHISSIEMTNLITNNCTHPEMHGAFKTLYFRKAIAE